MDDHAAREALKLIREIHRVLDNHTEKLTELLRATSGPNQN
jgi:hypothetical protein